MPSNETTDAPNFFDDLGHTETTKESLQASKYSDEKAARLDYLIHQTFEQNAAGKELMGIWKEALIMTPTASEGMGLLEVGIAEGHKRFIRAIILTIKRTENT